MKIGIDIDDTITYSWEIFIPHYAELFNISKETLKKSHPYYGSVYKDMTKEEYFKKTSPIYEKYAPTVPLKDNVKEVIDALYELGHTVTFITNRGIEYTDAYKTTKEYLDKYGIKYDKLVVGSSDKAKVCKEENIELFIDDSIKHCTEVSKLGIEVIMFDNPYNQEAQEFRHLKNWNEIYEYIKSR